MGRSIDFEITRQVICPLCKGTGARKPSDVKECDTCGGHGARIVRHQLGPGIFQQVQMQCDVCGGQGKQITHLCKQCNGERTIEQVNSLTVDLDRGVPDGYEETFEGEADESPDLAPGDVVLRIRTRKQTDGGFRRKQESLYWKETLRLDEVRLSLVFFSAVGASARAFCSSSAQALILVATGPSGLHTQGQASGWP